jgi:hypothetical protein
MAKRITGTKINYVWLDEGREETQGGKNLA